MPDLWSRIRNALRREAHDVQESIDDMTRRGNAALDAKERELAASPEERLHLEQERAEQAHDEFEAFKRKIEDESS